MNDISSVIGKAIIGTASVILMIIWSAAWSGWALATVWGWFIVPVFSLPALGILQAYGVVLVVDALKGLPAQAKEDKDGFWAVVLKAFIAKPIAALAIVGVGYVVKTMI